MSDAQLAQINLSNGRANTASKTRGDSAAGARLSDESFGLLWLRTREIVFSAVLTRPFVSITQANCAAIKWQILVFAHRGNAYPLPGTMPAFCIISNRQIIVSAIGKRMTGQKYEICHGK